MRIRLLLSWLIVFGLFISIARAETPMVLGDRLELMVDRERVVALCRVDPERAQRLVEQIARRKA